METAISILALLVAIASFLYSWRSSRRAEKLLQAEKLSEVNTNMTAIKSLMGSLGNRLDEQHALIEHKYPEGAYVPVRVRTWALFNQAVDEAMAATEEVAKKSSLLSKRRGFSSRRKVSSSEIESLRGATTCAVTSLRECVELAERLVTEHVDADEFKAASKALLKSPTGDSKTLDTHGAA